VHREKVFKKYSLSRLLRLIKMNFFVAIFLRSKNVKFQFFFADRPLPVGCSCQLSPWRLGWLAWADLPLKKTCAAGLSCRLICIETQVSN
jgi:hypothetical protein